MNQNRTLRKLPAVDHVLRSEGLREYRELHSHSVVVTCIRESIRDFRIAMALHAEWNPDDVLNSIVDSVQKKLQSMTMKSLRPVINATGIILHTNLGRAPLASKAIERMLSVAAYTNLELDIDSGKRSRRGENVTRLLAMATGAEDALVVNNCAAATILVLQSLAMGREVIISRGQLVEIGGGFRLPEVFKSAGVILREVGTTNRTYFRDYHEAICPATGAVILVHPSNFSQTGFVSAPSVMELVSSLKDRTFPVIHDIGSGNLYDLSQFRLNEPSVKESIQSGVDLCLFSGDKLFGGPQCGVIVGKRFWMDQLRSNSLMRALRVDKSTLGALEATAEIHMSGKAFEQLPTLQMLATPLDEVHSRCLELHGQLTSSIQWRLSVCKCESFVGGGTLPSQGIPSFSLQIEGAYLDQLAKSLRLGIKAILPRLSENKILLDMRTVDSRDIGYVASRLQELLAEPEG
ncbi:MAG: L-seryl-tRNA(Sec) selenium transferase [Pirellula sp.]